MTTLLTVQLDKQYDRDHVGPYVDVDEWRDEPVRHRYIHGGFQGCDTRFSLYFPTEDSYEGRFFQFISPVPLDECSMQHSSGQRDMIGFSIRSGAYFLETNSGGDAPSTPGDGSDPSYASYRASAACASLSRDLAALVYPNRHDRPYGYVYGGSGGAYRTVAAAENTTGVWDGFVPFVMGCPMSIPSAFSVTTLAARVLTGKFAGIVDALDAGGSGDPYAGLSDQEAAVLREATLMGVPQRSWFSYANHTSTAFTNIYTVMRMVDPTYFDDFWNKPGYEGYEQDPLFRDVRRRGRVTVAGMVTEREAVAEQLMRPRREGDKSGVNHAFEPKSFGAERIVGFRVDPVPEDQPLGVDALVRTGACKGREFHMDAMRAGIMLFGNDVGDNPPELPVGTVIDYDNSGYLAMQAYHRHQVPPKELGYVGWDQFRDEHGNPIPPQRATLFGPGFLKATGCEESGVTSGRMIAVSSLLDGGADPWQAAWYAKRVRAVNPDNPIRLWYTDNAEHTDDEEQENPTHIISYVGILQESLLQLADWVEHGVEPAKDTEYRLEDGQVIVSDTSTSRGGVQPVVTLTANGGDAAHVEVGESVEVRVVARAQSGSADRGMPLLYRCDWELDGTERFGVTDCQEPSETLDMTRTCSFDEPGTYFVAAYVSAQRNRFAGTECNRINNVARARIVVE